MPTTEDHALELTATEPDAVAPARDGQTSDEALMLAYQAGHAAAFDQLYRRHKDGLFRFVLRSVPERAQAEEIFQDAWMSVIRARERYKPSARFGTWLYQIAHNRMVDLWRRQRPQTELDDELADDAAGPEQIVTREDGARRLLALIAALPAEQRVAVLLHEEREMTLDEIAAVTGSGRETIKSRLRYALDKLRRGMADD